MMLPEYVDLNKVKALADKTACPSCGKTGITIFNFGTEMLCTRCFHVGPLPNKEELL